jgi:aminoglycoside phosphotransferase (APT) family kinase protein
MSDATRDPWEPDYELTPEAARCAIESTRPDLRPVELKLLGSGWDFWAYLVNGRWVFRFPRRAEEQGRLRKEHAVLPVIEPHLDLQIPRYDGPLLQDAAVPYVFGVYEKVEGVQAHCLSSEDLDVEAIGHQLGHLFQALHSIPRAEVEAVTASTQRRERDPLKLRESSRRYLRWLPAEDRELCERLQAFCSDGHPLPPLFTGTEVLAHTDAHEEHLLLSPQRPHELVGVLDWGDVSFSDPALDLSAAYPWGGEIFLRAILEAYGSPDEELEARARYVGISLTLLELDYARRLGQTGAKVENLLDVLRRASF